MSHLVGKPVESSTHESLVLCPVVLTLSLLGALPLLWLILRNILIAVPGSASAESLRSGGRNASTFG